MPLRYKLGGPQEHLVFSEAALKRLERHRQRYVLSREAGGQLFASFTRDSILIEIATGPYRSDRRERYRFDPDPVRTQQDIDRYFPHRLHFVGNWHTHPQKVPSPSSTDIANAHQRFLQSDHSLTAFVVVVVGTATFPLGLYVSLLDGTTENVLSPEEV